MRVRTRWYVEYQVLSLAAHLSVREALALLLGAKPRWLVIPRLIP